MTAVRSQRTTHGHPGVTQRTPPAHLAPSDAGTAHAREAFAWIHRPTGGLFLIFRMVAAILVWPTYPIRPITRSLVIMILGRARS
jgi:hypothetical protein